jgi:radical SAM superfamily enzyme YgiQ (UPF0313 family)
MRNFNLGMDRTGLTAAPPSLDYNHLELEISAFKPNLIGISIFSSLVSQSKKIIQFIKTKFPSVIIVVGGPHLSLDGREFIEESLADIGVVGEGEYTVQEICEYFRGQRNLDSIKGIIYRQDGQIVETLPREFITDLDSLPFPNYEYYTSVITNRGIVPSYPIVTSRGCPYSCTFCCSPIVSGKRWRSRTVESILQELNYAKMKYRISSVNFMDDNFMVNKQRAKEILRAIIADKNLDLNIDFLAGVRVDLLDDELIELISQARVQCISVGIESADPEVLRIIKKGVEIERIKEVIIRLKKARVNTYAYFIIGLPGSSYKKDIYSIEWAKKLGVSTSCTLANAYPGTEMWRWVKKNARLLSSYKDSSMSYLEEGQINFDTPAYPAEKRAEVYRKALISTRDFNRLEALLKGIKKYIRVNKLILKYEKKALINYHIYLLFAFVRKALQRTGLYYPLIKKIDPRIATKLLFWKK